MFYKTNQSRYQFQVLLLRSEFNTNSDYSKLLYKDDTYCWIFLIRYFGEYLQASWYVLEMKKNKIFGLKM